jgi:hypothetical protein
MLGNQKDLEDIIRRSRPEVKLGADFNQRVMRQVARASQPSDSRYYTGRIRIAGASLVLAGILLFIINTSPLGQNMYVLGSTVKSATQKMDEYRFKLPDLSGIWKLDFDGKRDKK